MLTNLATKLEVVRPELILEQLEDRIVLDAAVDNDYHDGYSYVSDHDYSSMVADGYGSWYCNGDGWYTNYSGGYYYWWYPTSYYGYSSDLGIYEAQHASSGTMWQFDDIFGVWTHYGQWDYIGSGWYVLEGGSYTEYYIGGAYFYNDNIYGDIYQWNGAYWQVIQAR